MLGQWQWGFNRGWSEMRASDADRDRAIAALREHCAAGRIGIDELSERLDHVLRARTIGELMIPLRDLPSLDGQPALPVRQQRARRGRLAILMLVVLVLIASRSVMYAGHASTGALLIVVIVAAMLARMTFRATRLPRRR